MYRDDYFWSWFNTRYCLWYSRIDCL